MKWEISEGELQYVTKGELLSLLCGKGSNDWLGFTEHWRSIT